MTRQVFIAEDEPNIVEPIRFLLTRAGCEVSAVNDGQGAISRLRGWRPDLVILDIMMPGCNGFEVLKFIRQHPGLANLPVLMLSAKGQVRDRECAEALGATAFMTKPFSNQVLVDTALDLMGELTHEDP